MKKYLRGIWFGLEYILLNHFVCHIPSWSIRKFFYVIFGIKIGKHSRIGMNTTIVCPKKIKIGYNTIINEKCHLDGRGKLEIGNNTSISFGTVIITATHQLSDFAYREENVIIEDNVWIGVNAIILNGSILKKGSVIGAGCVVKSIAEEKTVYAGNPMKKIKYRDNFKEYEINYHPFFR